MKAEQILERFYHEVDTAIEDNLLQISPEIANFARYALGWVDESFQPTQRRSGKKLRPALALLVYEAIAGSIKPAMPLAVALELIHNYSLIHDDIEDRDVERRGRPTVWRLWGESLAINVGDTLHALAFRALLHGDLAPAPQVLEIYQALAQTSCRLCEGQHLDLSFEKTIDIDQAMYLDMIGRKTMALIECSTFMAARLATDDEQMMLAYRNFGSKLGFAFQIRDDFLNLWGDTGKVGKDQYSDLRSKKKTLPVIYALDSLTGGRSERLRALYADNGQPMQEDDIRYVLQVLQDVQAREYTAQMADQYIDEALGWLDRTGLESPAQAQLRTLARFLGGREY